MAKIKTSEVVKSMRPVQRAVYAYTTPTVPEHNGWIKIGDTEVKAGENLKDAVRDRINQQTHTADIKTNLEWTGRAKFEDDEAPFRDYDFHRYLEQKKNIVRKPNTEWFNTTPNDSHAAFNEFRDNHGILKEVTGVQSYTLREEQEEAVSRTAEYFVCHEKGEFLWNAKPRFGKTLSVYDFCKRVGALNVLVLTNRPAIADSWYSDYERFVGTEGGYYFISQVDTLKGKKYVLPSREAYNDLLIKTGNMLGSIEFVSLQNLKGSIYFGGDIDKLAHISNDSQRGLVWDVLVLDEAHEGVDTDKTDIALDHIARKFTLNLSGTPFKMLATDKFSEEAIYNWTYADEQRKKLECEKTGEENPYSDLPKLNLFTYQMSEMMDAKAKAGTIVDDEDEQYYFDLNEFFKTTDSGHFEHLADVKKFLDSLVEGEKYPFSTSELRAQLKHTFWLLNRVDSAKALKKLLNNHPLFEKYHVILAAGNGDDESANRKAINEVKDAIKEHEYTITLSVGQLTTGVTIPEWSAVLMLCSLKSPALYMQAAFRAQNPCFFMDKDGQTYRKDNAYVFDFDPARTLTIMETIANDQYKETAGGYGDSDTRKQNVRELLNFFPVIGEDDDGEMIELDAEKVLSIPRHIHAKEVVRHGFMSNFLFQNISGIFSAPSVVNDILVKVNPVSQKEAQELVSQRDVDELDLDDNGEPSISDELIIGTAQEKFGAPVFGEIVDDFVNKAEALINTSKPSENDAYLDTLSKMFKTNVTDTIVDTATESFGKEMSTSQKRLLENSLRAASEKKFKHDAAEFMIETKKAAIERDVALEKCNSDHEEAQITAQFEKKVEECKQKLIESISNTQELVTKATTETVKAIEKSAVEKKKKDIEDKVRDHLRGFARTIPSFLMAYGDENTTLATFECNIPPKVFEDVTSITIENFLFLRDGGDYIEDGVTKHYAGHLFDSVVFDDSVKEFLHTREKLANYFDEDSQGDIFDYIPPQKTNQIYTPKTVVKQMVDLFENENPGCFDNPEHTFADLYMKSGLYITEIIKRLYRSEAMKEKFPDNSKRFEYIIEHQVYGAAPTEIIYMIAIHYIFGYKGDIGNWSIDDLQTLYPNFRMKDTAILAKEGKLSDWVIETFVDVFDGKKEPEEPIPTVSVSKNKSKKNPWMKIKTNDSVVHKVYGAGIVVNVSSDKITVKFSDDAVRDFSYPNVFTDGYLKTV